MSVRNLFEIKWEKKITVKMFYKADRGTFLLWCFLFFWHNKYQSKEWFQKLTLHKMP